MKKLLLTVLGLIILFPMMVSADRDVAVGVAAGLIGDTYGMGSYSYLNSGIYAQHYIGGEHWGFVSQGMVLGVPIGVDVPSVSDSYDGIKLAQSLMLGLGFRSVGMGFLRSEVSLGLGLHSVLLQNSDDSPPSLGTFFAAGPSLGLGYHLLLGESMTLGLVGNFHYALFPVIKTGDLEPKDYEGGIAAHVGVVMGFKY